LRRATVRVESRLDGSLHLRFQQHYLSVSLCTAPPKTKVPVVRPHPPQPARPASPERKQAHHDFLAAPAPLPLWKAAQIDCTRTTDALEE
jgi:hypothetical protein